MLDLAEKQRVRAVNDRKIYLINELERIGYIVNQNKRISEFDLFELEQIHINEKCRIANSPFLREIYGKTL